MSKGKEAAGRPRTLHAATNEEEVEEFVHKGWPAGNASQPAKDFHVFAETRCIPTSAISNHRSPGDP